MMNIGDQRPVGDSSAAGDTRPAGDTGPAGDTRNAGEEHAKKTRKQTKKQEPNTDEPNPEG